MRSQLSQLAGQPSFKSDRPAVRPRPAARPPAPSAIARPSAAAPPPDPAPAPSATARPSAAAPPPDPAPDAERAAACAPSPRSILELAAAEPIRAAARFRARLDCDERRRRSPSPTESLVELMRRVNSNDSMDFRLCVARAPAALEAE